MADDGQVKVVISAADQTGQAIRSSKEGMRRYQRELKEAEKRARELEEQAKRTAETLRNKSAIAFGVLATAIGATVKVAGDFEAAMARAGAISGATGAQFDEMRQKALEMGASTVFSASQSAEALTYLAMAGFSARQSIESLPGILNMATAGAVDLATAADIGSNILSGFGLQASEMGRVADILAKGFTSSNVSLVELGEAMKYLAPVASALGISIEQVTAMVGALGNSGIKGGMAGRQLRGALADLIKPSAEAAKVMEDLGIKVTDDAGRMRSLTDILRQMQGATASMTDTQRAATVTTLVGTQSMSAFLALMQQGPDALDEMTRALENAGGTAENIAKRQIDTLRGSMQTLKSQAEDAAIAIGDSFVPNVRAGASILGDFAGTIAYVARENPKLIGSLGTLTVTVLGTTAAVSGLAVAWRGLQVAMGPYGWAIAGVGALAGVLTNTAIRARAAAQEHDRQNESLMTLNREYERLNKILTDTTATEEEKKRAQQELNQVKDELGKLMPELVSQWSAEGKAIEINTERLRENTQAAKENLQAKARAGYEAARKAEDEARAGFERILKERDDQLENARSLLAFHDKPEETEKALEVIRNRFESEIAAAARALTRASAEVRREAAKAGVSLGPYFEGPFADDWMPLPSPDENQNGATEAVVQSYKEALRWVEYLKRTGQITALEELAHLQRISEVNAQTQEEKWDITERIYALQKSLSEQEAKDTEAARRAQVQASLRLLDHQLRMNQISAKDEIQRLQEILQTHDLTAEERMGIEERLAAASDKLAKGFAAEFEQTQQAMAKSARERVEDAIRLLNHQQRTGQLTRDEEIAALEEHLRTERGYYQAHVQERWSIEERLYALREQARQEDLRREAEAQRETQSAVVRFMADAERAEMDRIRRRQQAVEAALQREISLKEEQLKLFDRELSVVDRLQKIEDARKRIADLRQSGRKEEVILADGTKEMRTVGMLEAEEALAKAQEDHRRATQREELQDQISHLREQLAALKDGHGREIEEQRTHWANLRQLAEQGLGALNDTQVNEMELMVENLGRYLGTMEGQWETHLDKINGMLSKVGAPTLPALPGGAGTITPPLVPPLMPAAVAQGAGGFQIGTIDVDVNLPAGWNGDVNQVREAAQQGVSDAVGAFERGIGQGVAGGRSVRL